MKFNLLKKSRWLHKYFGLVLLLFLAWMSISGVLLNHPNIIKNIGVNKSLIPDSYIPNNWNRSTLKNILYTKNIKQDSLLLYGNEGIFISSAKANIIKPYMRGDFPTSPRLKRTNHLWADTINNRILAATNNGLYVCWANKYKWEKIPLHDNNEPIVKILALPHSLVLVSKSAFYVSEYTKTLSFKKVVPNKKETEQNVSLITIFFALHDGSIWGLPGKIIWDIAGIIFFFLCVSAFYVWYYPKKWKRKYKRKKKKTSTSEKTKHKFFLKYHKKLGWYASIILLIIVITGMFLRPPLIMAIFKAHINKKWYPAIKNPNPWHHKIRNALYDSQSYKIVLDCSDGIWAGNLQNNITFEKQNIPISVFAMGATVFEEEKPNTWLVGSFGGLSRYNTLTQKSESVLQIKKTKGRGMPGSLLVTGYIKAPNGENYVLGHYKGLCNLKGNEQTNAIKMPNSIKQNYKMPFWNFLFEIHNARIFKSILGGFYMLVIPLGGLLSLLILLSGIFDYWNTKLKTNKRLQKSNN